MNPELERDSLVAKKARDYGLLPIIERLDNLPAELSGRPDLAGFGSYELTFRGELVANNESPTAFKTQWVAETREEVEVSKPKPKSTGEQAMNNSINEAVCFFRKACIEYGADKSLDNANMVFEEQKNLFSAIQRALQPATD